jgi:phage major head subunit gpT-like protein
MEITTPNIQQFFQLVDFTFRDAVLKTPKLWDMFAKLVPSKTEKNVYPWLSNIPGLRPWLGPRFINNIATREYSLINQPFEDSIGIDKYKLEDDVYGFFEGVTAELGQRVAEFPDSELASTVESGQTTLCYDGQDFFSGAHPVDIDDPSKGTFSNNLVGSAYDLSIDPKSTFRAVRSAMMQFLRDDGKPLGLVGDTLMVPPAWEGYAKDAVEATFITSIVKNAGTPVAAAGMSNVFYGVSRVIVNPWLTVQNAGYLLCTTRSVMPFLYQQRQPANFVPRVSPDMDNVWMNRRFEWGVDMRAAFGYTFPFLAVRFAAS